MDVAAAFAGIAQQFSATFGAGFHAGVARWAGTPVTVGGSIVTPGTPFEMDCMVQVDAVTEAMRLAEGYRDQDMRLLVLRHGLAREIDTDATVEVLAGPHVGAWKVVRAFGDGCGIYFEGLGRRA